MTIRSKAKYIVSTNILQSLNISFLITVIYVDVFSTVLSVLRFTASEYPFGIFKYSLCDVHLQSELQVTPRFL